MVLPRTWRRLAVLGGATAVLGVGSLFAPGVQAEGRCSGRHICPFQLPIFVASLRPAIDVQPGRCFNVQGPAFAGSVINNTGHPISLRAAPNCQGVQTGRVGAHQRNEATGPFMSFRVVWR